MIGQHNTETQQHNTEKMTDQKIGLTTRLSALTFTDNDANIGLRLQSKQGEVANRRIVLGFEGEKNMPKLIFSGNLVNTIRNSILKLPVIPAGAFSIIQDGVQDGRQNVNTAI